MRLGGKTRKRNSQSFGGNDKGFSKKTGDGMSSSRGSYGTGSRKGDRLVALRVRRLISVFHVKRGFARAWEPSPHLTVTLIDTRYLRNRELELTI